MKHLYRIIFALLLYLSVVYLWGYARPAETPASPTSPPAEESALSPQQLAEIDQLQARQTEEHVQELQARGRQQDIMEVATREMPASRQMAQTEALPAWTGVLTTNHEKYLTLLAQAKDAPRGQVVCTICDSFSYMPCVMCQDHDGKCTRCRGSGRLGLHVYCPTCLGKGKCYVCSGSGKMLCPFCNDGMIDIHWPAPSLSPP